MSHQTGIQANAELKKYFTKCRDGKIRVLKVSIDNEQLILSKYQQVKGSWEHDFDKYVPSLVVDDLPCYILYRFDSTNSVGHEWLLLSWSPDSAPVRQKMLYASTKATLKQEFGTAHIKDEMHATSKDEVSLKGYKAHLTGVNAPAPLTDREEALKELQQNEHSPNYGTDSRQSTMGGVAFPITQDAKQGIIDLQHGSYNYLQFKIVFIYSMPGYSCSIKERMLYSSCIGTFLDIIEKMGIEIAKRLEIGDGKELTEEFLYDEIHPKRNLHRPAFAKPKGPPNRGAKRITKSQASQ
ncbi:Twinfilin [Papilio machaon]|uniref:Twinfilin n=1 Tax=Papilio machaon TaxID=76193 RepID=A0A194R5Z9_PAPMA|nr:Twinfilin [Papilio machaon]